MTRTRIAPSPTGQDFHIGNAYTALINYVFAKKHGGDFLIRIEDTDQTRLVPGAVERILASLHWLGITHDEGPDKGGPHAPYKQSERLAVYKKHAELLIEKGHAYYCFCTAERLKEMREKQEANREPPMYDGHCVSNPRDDSRKRIAEGATYVIRLKVPDSGTTSFQDLVRGEISFENKLLDDQVLLKSDGFPTYHLGVVVDDHLMKITHVIRGEEWISSTPKHILLYSFFGWDLPQYAHMPVLRNPDKSKLSKRKNPVWVSHYRDLGVLPEAIRNYLATMAWAHPEGKEIFSTEEMMRVFEITQIQTTAPIFNADKLRWMNGEYIRQMNDTELLKALHTFDSSIPTEDLRFTQILPLIRERMKTLSECMSLAGFFFSPPAEYERQPESSRIAALIRALTAVKENWNHDALEAAVRKASEENGEKPKEMFMDLRLAVSGKTVGPPLLESLEILGFEETMTRLNHVVS